MRSGAVPAVVLVLAVLVSACGEQTKRYLMPAASMEPTLAAGEHFDAVLVDDYEPRRGDVVVFDDPGGWLGLDTTDGLLVKRVIGVPGDTVTCCDERGRIGINGVAQDEDYVASDPGAACAGPMPVGELSCRWSVGPVPDGRLFVMGDNRANSVDSSVRLCPEGRDCDPDDAFVPVEGVVALVED